MNISSTTIVIYLLFMVIIRVEALPPIIGRTSSMVCAALVNIMACRVYRNTKSGLYLASVDGPSLPTICFAESVQTRGIRVSMAEACPLTVVLGVIHEGQQDSKESVGVSEKER